MNQSEKAGKIGVPFGDDRPPAFELCVSEYVPALDPADFGLDGPAFDPRSYFVTSGDAVAKTRVMIRDLRAMSETAAGGWADAVSDGLRRAELMLAALISARGPHVFLETEHEDHRLWVIPKDPRKRGEPG